MPTAAPPADTDIPSPPLARASGPLRRLDELAPWLFAAIALVLYRVSSPRYPTEWDSVQLVLGLDRFDTTEGSPHPPGYWLYVALGRLVRGVTPLDGTDSMEVLAALAAAATVALSMVLARRIGGRWLALATGAFLLTSPFVLFYGATVGTYTFDALTSVALLLLALATRPGSWHPVVAAGVLGLGAGLRQTSLLVLGPIVAVAVWKGVRSARALAAAGAAGAAGIAVWLVPMLLEQPGGWARYRRFTQQYVYEAFSTTTPLYGAEGRLVLTNMGEAASYTLAAVAVLLPLAVLGLVLPRRRAGAGREPLLLLALAFTVPFAFVVVVHFGKAGYVLSYLPALAVLLLLPAARTGRRARIAAGLLLAVLCVVQLQRFTSAYGLMPRSLANRDPWWFTYERHGAPFPLTRAVLTTTDRETEEWTQGLREAFDPDRDILVFVHLNGGHRFRHVTYLLPAFRVNFIIDRRNVWHSHRHRYVYERDYEIEVPPGGRAVFALDAAFPEVQEQMAAGRVEELQLPTGPLVWVAEPGAELFGVRVVERDGG